MQPSDAKPDRHLPDADSMPYRVLMGNAPGMRTGRRIMRAIPAAPRCKLCAAPIRGPLAPLLRAVGKGPWPKNPKYCGWCFKGLVTHRGGAEIDCSLLFADVRGSTALAETMRPGEFKDAMDRYFAVASQVLIDHDAIVDKFVGDEVVAIFIPAMTGELHARRAVDAGIGLLAATMAPDAAPGLPIGIGVNTGTAYVGTVGSGDNVEFSAMGDVVNVAARLASAAGPGELLVTTAAASAADLIDASLERRELALKGKTGATEVVILHA
jgi:adenylate cyclase